MTDTAPMDLEAANGTAPADPPPPLGASPTDPGATDPTRGAARDLLLGQFYATLRVTYLAAQPAPGPDRNSATMHARIDALLNGAQSWRGAYEIEQLLAFVMTDDQVAAELPRRLAEAKTRKLDCADELERQYRASDDQVRAEPDQRPQVEIARRYILHRLLNDLQWYYDQRIRRRDAATSLLKRISILFLSALFYFFLLLFLQVFFSNPPPPGRSPATAAPAPTGPATAVSAPAGPATATGRP